MERELGPIDNVVHWAGIGGPFQSAFERSDDAWRRIRAVHADGTFYVCRATIPPMVVRGYGRVVLISSIAGKDGHPVLPAYAASKGGGHRACQVSGAWRDVTGSGVLVNVVTPAVIATPLALDQAPEVIEQMVSHVPLGRMGTPDEAAAPDQLAGQRGLLILYRRGLRPLGRPEHPGRHRVVHYI